MEIQLKEITIRELTEGYEDKGDDGVVGYAGRLDIRPPFQREFIYKDTQRAAVIDTLIKGFPLNVMYWAHRGDDSFEIIDGQQRTISICQYVIGDFSFEKRYFHNLQDDEQARILDYTLMVYVCSGKDSEKLQWFKTINIAGEKLADQELRNAVYAGPWVTDAKRYFSKRTCPAYGLGSKYLDGSAIRQDYLETTIKWIYKGDVETYMAQHQYKKSAAALWQYFEKAIHWVQVVFTTYRKEMKGIAWGDLYNTYKDETHDAQALETEVSTLMQDDDVTSKKGIYSYVLTREEKHLNIRTFNDKQKREAYERQGGICNVCKEHFPIEEMEADHITPWHEGGKTSAENCNVLCKHDNRRKSGK